MGFALGLNHPWVSCGHDFGLRPPQWQGASPRDWAHVEAELRQHKALGIDWSRWWVLAGGVNYPVGQEPDVRLQRRSGRLGESFELPHGGRPPALGTEFEADFESLLVAAERTGMRLIPSLLSFEFFFPILAQGGSEVVFSQGRGPLAIGRPDQPVESAVDAFLDATLSPLLEVSKRHRRAIGLWEVANEPDWVVEGGPLHLRVHRGRATIMPKSVSARSMCILLGRALERIVEAGFVSSIGFKQASPAWLSPRFTRLLRTLGGRGEYVHQVHYYPSLHEPRRLPRHASLPFQPCWVGELPTAHGRWLHPFHMRWLDGWAWWKETNPELYLRRRLELVRDRGYPGALLWSARANDGASAWDASQQAQIRAFNKSR